MTLTIGIWVVPAIITIAAIVWPLGKGSDAYGIGGFVELALKLPVILFVWLAFFAVSYFFT